MYFATLTFLWIVGLLWGLIVGSTPSFNNSLFIKLYYIEADQPNNKLLPHVSNVWIYHKAVQNTSFSESLSSSCVLLCLPLGISCQSEEGWKPEGHLGAAWLVSESRQPADDHADQSQEATRHQAEVYHCQTGASQQPSSSSQVRAVFFFFVDNTKSWLEHKVVWALILAIWIHRAVIHIQGEL